MSTDSTKLSTVSFKIAVGSEYQPAVGYGDSRYVIHASLSWDGSFTVSHAPTGMALAKSLTWDKCLSLYHRIKDIPLIVVDGKVEDNSSSKALRSVLEEYTK